MTLAEQINTSLGTIVDWDVESDLPYFGQVFGKAVNADIDTAIAAAQTAEDWRLVAHLKRRAEHLNYSSSTIDTAVKAALDGISMFTNYDVPINYVSGGNWWAQERGVYLNFFRWAQELSYQTSKFVLQDCYDGLKAVRDAQSESYYRCNPDTGAVTRSFGGRAHYCSLHGMQWLMFHELAITNALTEAEDEWSFFNSEFWSTDHYIYAPDWVNWEFCFPTHFFCWTKLYIEKGRTLTNWDRLITDMQLRYVADLWDSMQWGYGMSSPAPYGAAVHHNSGNSQRRLLGTLNAWIVLNAAYKKFTTSNKTNMKNLLEGTTVTKASDKFIDSDTSLFVSASNKFKNVSDGSVSDKSTCYGCLALFLLGISPQTGSLAVPIVADNHWVFDMNCIKPSHFQFLYADRKIRIPVWAGEIKFTFGTASPAYTFPSDGIYEVTFASDWNSISDVTRISDLLATEDYIDQAIYTIAGITRDASGDPLGNCTVWLFRTSDQTFIEEKESDINGSYSFDVTSTTTQYFVRAHKDGSPNVFGVSDRDLVGS